MRVRRLSRQLGQARLAPLWNLIARTPEAPPIKNPTHARRANMLARGCGVFARWVAGQTRAATVISKKHALSTMSPAAKPQLLACAFGAHKSGAVAKLSGMVFENGGSIAVTKKVVAEDHFAFMASIYLPPDATSLEDFSNLLQSAETTKALGFPVIVKNITRPVENEAASSEQRRLKLVCPQRPGLVLAITELLKDHGCSLSSIDAETFQRENEIWFEIECLVDIPSEADIAQVSSDLEYWAEHEKQARLTFDKWLKPNTTGMAV